MLPMQDSWAGAYMGESDMGSRIEMRKWSEHDIKRGKWTDEGRGNGPSTAEQTITGANLHFDWHTCESRAETDMQ